MRESEKKLKPHMFRESQIYENSRFPETQGAPEYAEKETETITGFRLSVVYFFGGHPPAPENYFSEESIWQAFEPS